MANPLPAESERQGLTLTERIGQMAKVKNKQTYQEFLAEMAQIKVTCAKCGRKDAQLSPMGVLCLTCTFGQPMPKLES